MGSGSRDEGKESGRSMRGWERGGDKYLTWDGNSCWKITTKVARDKGGELRGQHVIQRPKKGRITTQHFSKRGA